MTTPITRISAASLEFVRVKVAARESGVDVDPTLDTVSMAFISTGSAPGTADWKAASWETDASTDPDTYYARCLVGTGGSAVLAADTYAVWVKITDNPEVPQLKAPGKLVVF